MSKRVELTVTKHGLTFRPLGPHETRLLIIRHPEHEANIVPLAELMNLALKNAIQKRAFINPGKWIRLRSIGDRFFVPSDLEESSGEKRNRNAWLLLRRSSKMRFIPLTIKSDLKYERCA